MSLTYEQVQANLRSARNLAANQVGIRGAYGQDPEKVEMTYEQRIAYNKALAAIIAKFPERFNAPAMPGATKTPVEIAAVVNAKQYEPLASQSLGESVKIFAAEMASQAADLHKTFNPFEQSNRKMFRNVLIIGAVLAAAVYFGPALLQGSRRLKSSFK